MLRVTPGVSSQVTLPPNSSQPIATPFVLPNNITGTKNTNENLKSGFAQKVVSFLFSGKKTNQTLHPPEKNRKDQISQIQNQFEVLISKRKSGNVLLRYLSDVLRAGFTFEEVMPQKFIDSNTEAVKSLVTAAGVRILCISTSDKEIISIFNNIINKLYNNIDKEEIISNKAFLSREMFSLLSNRTTIEKPFNNMVQYFQNTLRMKNEFRYLAESYSAPVNALSPKVKCMPVYGYSELCEEIRREIAGEHYSRLSADDIASHLNIISISIAEINTERYHSSQQRKGLPAFFEYVDCMKSLLKALHSAYHKINEMIITKTQTSDGGEPFYYSEKYKFEGNIQGFSVPRLATDKISLFDNHAPSAILNPKINAAITAIDKLLTARYFSDE
ncbi:hypothetical protein SC171_21820 [Pantoea cypripedii]|uniref:hypothetical protein n=1 Tax=Pantoea cypripedii TaxID=55209 RepID=UPI002FC642DB